MTSNGITEEMEILAVLSSVVISSKYLAFIMMLSVDKPNLTVGSEVIVREEDSYSF